MSEQSEDSKTYRVVSLEVENFKRIQMVRVEPAPDEVCILGGPNRSGKTSMLDAIEVLMSGQGALPIEPIRHGARRMKIRGELASDATVDLIVEVEADARGHRLKVLGPDGEPIKKPQTFLNSLFSSISFDPLEFARADPPKQDKVLKDLVKLDFSDVDTRYQTAFADRTSVNAKCKSLSARIAAMPRHVGVPENEESVADLAAELERRQATQRKADELARQTTDAANAAAAAERAVANQKADIAELERRLNAAKDRLVELKNEAQDAAIRADDAKRVAEAHVVEDAAEVRQKLATIQETNRKVRENVARAQLSTELADAERRAQVLTDAIERCKEEKGERIASAPFPIPGLGFDESGVTYNGVPFAQSSNSDRITVSTAIGAALNPKLRVLLVRDGEKVGTEDMNTIRRIAREQHFQVFVEKFTESGEGCNVLLEDGRVKAAVAAE